MVILLAVISLLIKEDRDFISLVLATSVMWSFLFIAIFYWDGLHFDSSDSHMYLRLLIVFLYIVGVILFFTGGGKFIPSKLF
jgi:hypothetical protein